MNILTIIKKPVISEKSIKDSSRGLYSFIVAKQANKIEIKKAIEDQFKVHVLKITSEIIKGKVKLIGRTRHKVKLPDIKKARVRLKSGEKIAIFEVGEK